MEEKGEWFDIIHSEDERDNTLDEDVEEEQLGLAVIIR